MSVSANFTAKRILAPLVLIVDTEEANRRATARVLDKAGYRIAEAATVADALYAMGEMLPDLVILDVKLPDGNGVALCAEIKADPNYRHTPVLMISTAYVEGRDKADALDGGADGYLTAPADALELAATVRALLRVREAERNLKEADDRLRLMIESAQDYAIYALDGQGRICTWNAAAERLFGWREEEIVGQDGAILSLEEDREAFRGELDQAAATGKSVNEQRRRRKDGTVFHSAGTTAPSYNPNGDVLGFTKVERDITEHRVTQERLRKSQEVFTTLANCVPAMVWMSDPDRACYYLNKAWLDFVGETLEQQVGAGWGRSIHPDDLAGVVALYHASFEKHAPFEMRFRLRRHDGEYRWILARGAPHYNLDGSFAGYAGASIDIHDQVLAEDRLRISNERFDLAMQGMNDGLWDIDLVRNQLYLSQRYKSMLGYDEGELKTREDIGALIHPDDRETALATLDTTIRENRDTHKNVFRILHKNGRYRWILSRGMMVRDEQGRPVRMIGAHTDITEQKELETELRAARERAETANIAKTNFLANMSHEIRTPMNAIIGLANILASSRLEARQKNMIDTLHDSAESLLTLLNDLLDITKIEDAMITLEQVPFDLREVIDRVVALLAHKAEEKHLELRVDYPRDGRDRFVGDPLRIQQVITNLVSNAVKFTAAGHVAITVRLADDGVSIAIADTGIGIPADKTDSIFDKFTQADNSTTRKYGGSGLGLAICKGLVAHMGGTIRVTSEPGRGSTFTIRLPLPYAWSPAEESSRSAPQPVIAASDAARRILLVEDYPPNIMVASIVLESLGYAYDTAGEGAEAVFKFQQGQYYAVLMDIQMPGIDGYEATRRIRAWERATGAKPTPIIAVTAHALVGDREKCLEAGMDDYVSKPFTMDDLKTRLDALSDR